MVKNFFRRYGAWLAAAAVFIAVAVVYCYPELSGKVLHQTDITQWKCAARKVQIHNYRHPDDITLWAENMFCGMPAYQISAASPKSVINDSANAAGGFIDRLFHLFTKGTVFYLVGYLVAFYLLMRAFGIGAWLSIAGSVATSLSSYFLTILLVGHETKALTLAAMAVIMAGFVLIFKKKYISGAVLVMLYSSIGMMRHPQMAYYIFLLIGVLAIAEIVTHVREKRYKDLLIASGIFLASVGVGFGTGYDTYKSNKEYVSESTRGGRSELSTADEREAGGGSGLDIRYATDFSYGIDETLTLLIPDFKGGSSRYILGKDSQIYKTARRQHCTEEAAAGLSTAPIYWGSQRFTRGPVYVGAIVCFLFVLGLCIVSGPYKWALAIATLLSVLLAWGDNFIWLTRLFFNVMPLYSKFRTVASILVVAQFTMPLLGFLALREVLDRNADSRRLTRGVLVSAAVTGGICLFFFLFGGGIYDFTSPSDANLPDAAPMWFRQAIIKTRKALLQADCLRSLGFIAAAAALLWIYIKKVNIKPVVVGAAISALVFVDLWAVDRRYFPASEWQNRREEAKSVEPEPWEYELREDRSYFRVMDTGGQAYSDARASLRFLTLGGYHSAKLRRYDDLISHKLVKFDANAVNMLNAKYLLVEDSESGEKKPVLNPGAMGPAWFVQNVFLTDTPQEEMDAVSQVNLRTEAVTGPEFKQYITRTAPDPTARISMISHAPNRLRYESLSNVEKTAVFSEIYYPYGWKAYIDGNETPVFRVNYVLRAINVPPGKHDIIFEFRPDSIYRGCKVAAAFKWIMLLCVLAACGLEIWTAVRRKEDES